MTRVGKKTFLLEGPNLKIPMRFASNFSILRFWQEFSRFLELRWFFSLFLLLFFWFCFFKSRILKPPFAEYKKLLLVIFLFFPHQLKLRNFSKTSARIIGPFWEMGAFLCFPPTNQGIKSWPTLGAKVKIGTQFSFLLRPYPAKFFWAPLKKGLMLYQ